MTTLQDTSIPSEPERARRRALWRTVLAVTLVATLGVLAGRTTRSPAAQAAATAPPALPPVTAPVEVRALADVTLLDGILVEADGRATPTFLPETPVPTWLPRVGDRVDTGDVALELSGRPVIVLQGQTPSYRTLRYGDVGNDVEQLESSLVRLGWLDSSPDDQFDEDTSLALGNMYDAAGYSAPVEDELVLSAEAAQRELATAQEALAAASDEEEKANELNSRQAAALRERIAEVKAEIQRVVAAREVKQREITAALERLRAEVEHREDNGSTKDEVAEARQELRAAEAAAADELAGLDGAVRELHEHLAGAEEELEFFALQSDAASLARHVKTLRKEVALSTERAEQARLEALPYLPIHEYVFVPSANPEVVAAEGSLGVVAETPPVVLSSGSASVLASAPASLLDRISIGMHAAVDVGDESSRPVSGEVTWVAKELGPAAAAKRFPTSDYAIGELSAALVVTLANDIATAAVRDSVRIELSGEAKAEETPVIPVSAIHTDTQGRTRVLTREHSDESWAWVDVEVIAVVGGEAAVQAPLEVGQEVRLDGTDD